MAYCAVHLVLNLRYYILFHWHGIQLDLSCAFFFLLISAPILVGSS